MSSVSGRKPVWATEAGFQTAARSRDGQPPVSEKAGAVYLLRTFLEHFISGVRRTYAYELLDESAEPALRKSEQHFGLLRHDFSPKPAYTALRNLLALHGARPGAPPACGRCASASPGGPRACATSSWSAPTGRCSWRCGAWTASGTGRRARRPRQGARGAVALPGAASVRVTRPVAGTASGARCAAAACASGWPATRSSSR